MNTDIVVVGGGAAGIGAARQLARSGLSILLLEASSRLGGRAWTQEVEGLNLDLGCGWLHSAERNAWIGIAEAGGVPIDRSPAQWGVQYRDLGFPPSEQADARRAFGTWMQQLEASRAHSDRASDALAPNGEWNSYIRTIVGFISGGNLEQLSVADYLAYDEASSANNWRAPSGLGSLVARSFPAEWNCVWPLWRSRSRSGQGRHSSLRPLVNTRASGVTDSFHRCFGGRRFEASRRSRVLARGREQVAAGPQRKAFLPRRRRAF